MSLFTFLYFCTDELTLKNESIESINNNFKS